MSIAKKDNKQAFLCALEGPDRLGKSTQAKAIARAFRTGGAPFRGVVIKIPYQDPYTYDRIYDMLFSGEAVKHPEVFQSFQALNRHIFQMDNLPELARDYDLIVLDRWNMSTYAYGNAAGVTKEATDVMLKGIEQPDLTLIFRGTPFGMDNEKDSYEADDSFQNQVRAFYEQRLQDTPNCIGVDANRPQNDVTASLMSEIQQFMDSRSSLWRE